MTQRKLPEWAEKARKAMEEEGTPTPRSQRKKWEGVYSDPKGSEDGMAPLREHAEANIRDGKTLKNPDGSISTVRSGSVEDERLNGGKPTLIPFVWDGEYVDIEQAIDRAVKSGKKWPSFNSNEEATEASKTLSEGINPTAR